MSRRLSEAAIEGAGGHPEVDVESQGRRRAADGELQEAGARLAPLRKVSIDQRSGWEE